VYIKHIEAMEDTMRPKLMQRTNIYLTENQMKRFKALSKKKGVSVAELIRRVLDQWLEKEVGS
jgi:predicted DNA-binding protein